MTITPSLLQKGYLGQLSLPAFTLRVVQTTYFAGKSANTDSTERKKRPGPNPAGQEPVQPHPAAEKESIMVMYFWKRSASVWIALLYVLMGGLLMAFPATSSTVFVWALAIGAAGYGLSHLLRYWQERKAGTESPADLFLTVLPMAFTAFALAWPHTLLSFLPLVLGSLLMLDGVGKLPLAVMALRAEAPDTIVLLLSGLIPLVLGAVIVLNPFQTIQLVIAIFGFGLIADGILDFAALFTARHPR